MILKAIVFGMAILAGSTFHSVLPDQAQGTLSYQGKTKKTTVELTSVALISGPDIMDASQKFRRLIFSTADISAKIKSCATMGCVDDGFEGLQLDLVEGPRYNYWLSLNGQMTQYSGTCPPEALKLTTNTPERLAGSFTLPGGSAGGPVIQVTFDAKMVKKFSK